MKKSNQLIVVEPEQLTLYRLDDKQVWEVGRPSHGSIPDIQMNSPTVSRQQGCVRNVNGIWFYSNRKSKNGTFYNGKEVTCGIGGRVKPILLSHGDVLLFGAGTQAAVSSRTVWAAFLECCPEGEWRPEGTAALRKVIFSDGIQTLTLNNPQPGRLIMLERGFAIYMGEITWLIGEISVTGAL